MNKEHQKHPKLHRPSFGEWGRTELALLGTSCNIIRDFAEKITSHFSADRKIAFADADHHAEETLRFTNGAAVYFTDKIGCSRIDIKAQFTSAQKHALFNDCDLVLVNGNHFTARQQIIFIDPAKPLESKLARLSDVRLVLIIDAGAAIPDYLRQAIAAAPVMMLHETERIISFFENYLQQQIAPLNGLVLTGGKSIRMGTDKSLLNYHGTRQRDYVRELLQPLCRAVYLSCNASQSSEITAPKIEDRFLGIGPMGGILSAMQAAPDSAWLTVACDLPYLSCTTLDYLIAHRNPSKMATAFRDADSNLPEPLITIWEPRAYPVLLQALSEGYACPRKILMASDIVLLNAPDSAELQNVNDEIAYKLAISQLNVYRQNNPA